MGLWSLLMARSQMNTYVREYSLAQIQKQRGPSGHSVLSLGTVNWLAIFIILCYLACGKISELFLFFPIRLKF